jgi:hypothetical protein
MHVEGDGPQGQPAEGVVSLETLAEGLGSATALDEAAEGEEGGESEEVELEADGEADSAEEGEESAEELTFTIKVDGKEVVLTQSELIERAQKGHDYTAKTMALAEERKALEPVRKAAEEARQKADAAAQEAIERLEATAKFMQAQLGDEPPVEWAAKDPAYYLTAKAQHDSKKGQLQQALGELHRLKDEQHRQRQAALDQKAEATLRHLESTLPGWNDGELAALSAYIGKAGIRPETHADAFVESGLWEMAHKAKAYDALLAQKAALKPVKAAPKVHKPGASNPQPPQLAKRQEAMKAHSARPSIDTLAALL